MADKRAWAPIDIGYLDNPKMLEVLDASCNATLMHLASILYCAQHLTDGHVSPGVARRKVGASDEDVRILVDSGLWHDPDHDCDDCPQPDAGKVYVHNFLEHNRTSGAVKQVSETRSQVAKAGWEKRRRKQAAKAPKGDATSNAKSMQIAEQNDDVCNAEIDRERELLKTLSSDADASDPEPGFPDHVIDLCEHLAGKIRQNGNRVGTVGKAWHQSMDRLIRLDEYTPDQVRQVIDWCQQDEFWQGNIMSASKLREKFDQLKTRMFNERNKAAPVQPTGKPTVPNAYRMFNT